MTPRWRGGWADRLELLGPLGVYAFVTLAGLTTSSVGLLSSAGTGGVTGQIGTPPRVRSDEWLTQTPIELAVLANEANVAQLEHDRAVISARQAKLRGNAEEQAKRINAVSITVARKVGEQDKLFGSVTALDIAEALAAKGQKVDRRHIHLPEPIKTVGAHEVEIRLHHDVAARIKVEVVPES